MATAKETFLPSGPKLLEYATIQEPWTEYRLENGAVVRIRLVLTKVIDHQQFAPDGFPLYQLQWGQVLDVIWPDEMAREAKARRGE